MNPDQLFFALLDTLRTHIQLPEQYAWAPTAIIAGVGLIGLLLMIRGAKWAVGIGSIAFLALGGVGGQLLSGWLGTPLWPTVGIAAVTAFVLSIALFRLWQAVLLGGAAIAAALGAYYVIDLTPAANAWLGDGTTVTLRDAATPETAGLARVWTEAQSLFSHLATSVPNFQFNFWALAVSAGIAGLVFGLVLPRASCSLWAATVGTLTLGLSATSLLQSHAPDAFQWLLADAWRAWAIVGAAWLVSFIWNLVTSGPKRQTTSGDADGAMPAPVAA